jgi:hypothetical protein
VFRHHEFQRGLSWGLRRAGAGRSATHHAEAVPAGSLTRKILQIPSAWQTVPVVTHGNRCFPRPTAAANRYGVGRRDSARIMLPLSATSNSGR